MTDVPAIKQNANGIWMLEGEQLWDSDILQVCLEHIKEGDTVIDAGAWIGGHAMAYAKKVGALGRVFAFEPNPAAFECLVRNKQLYPNVHCLQVALGDKNILLPFVVEKGWMDSGHIGESMIYTEVKMSPLDDYMIKPNFIKIDVEGCELKVLNGAAKTIEKFRPKMVIELNQPALERQVTDSGLVVAWLVKHGYSISPIEKDAQLGVDIFNVICYP